MCAEHLNGRPGWNRSTARVSPDDRTLDRTAGYDPRTTPRGWLAASANESPDATLSRFVATTEELLAVLRALLAQGCRFEVQLPLRLGAR